MGLEMLGLLYQHTDVTSMVSEKDNAVSSKTVMGSPSLALWSSVVVNQKTCHNVMILHGSSQQLGVGGANELEHLVRGELTWTCHPSCSLP
jgi:hypothetical protein